MRKHLAFWLAVTAGQAAATPLTLYQADKDPLEVPGSGPVVACGGACTKPPAAPPTPKFGFEYGLEVSGTVAASNHGSAVGGAVSGWVKPDNLPVTLYFDVERYAPFGRHRW